MVIDRFGGPEALQLRDIARPEPRLGEVLIRVACASLNPADWKTREGMLAYTGETRFPHVLGFDAAGVVEAVGDGVSDYRPGDRAVTLSDQGRGGLGSYAEFVAVETGRTAHLPAHIGYAQAATLPVAGATAYGAVVDLGRTEPGQSIFVNGGAGGVGVFALQLARAAGARVATTCSPGNADFVRGFGAERAIDYHTEDVLAALRAWAPEGLDLIVDAVGLGSLPPQTAEVVRPKVLGPKGLRPAGRIVCIATLIKDAEGFDAQGAAGRGVEIIRNLSAIQRQPDHFRAVVEAVANGSIRAPPYEIVPLESAREALSRVQAGHVRGKIVLRVADL